MAKMTIKDFDEHERWQAFAKEYIANGGKQALACEAAGLNASAASAMKRANPEFVAWLGEIVDRKMSAAIDKADIQLAQRVASGISMNTDTRGTLKLLYERKAKIQTKLEVNTTINQGEALPPDIMEDLKDYLADKRLRERGLVPKNGDGT